MPNFRRHLPMLALLGLLPLTACDREDPTDRPAPTPQTGSTPPAGAAAAVTPQTDPAEDARPAAHDHDHDHADHDHHQHDHADGDQPAQAPAWGGDPYTLATCAVSGESLGNSPVARVHEGREFRFCCNNCAGRFEREPDGFIAAVDEKMIEDQKPHYPPLTACPVMPEEDLEELEKDEIEEVVYRNRFMRLCCTGCIRDLNKEGEAARAIAALDEAVIEAQRPDYPLETCVVGGGRLGSMGEPVEMVVANRLVRLCCAGCKGRFNEDPAGYLEKIDEARAARQASAAQTVVHASIHHRETVTTATCPDAACDAEAKRDCDTPARCEDGADCDDPAACNAAATRAPAPDRHHHGQGHHHGDGHYQHRHGDGHYHHQHEPDHG
jgi:YHS domain-containing protein